MSKYSYTVALPSVALSLALLVSLILLAAGGAGADSLIQAIPTTENTTETDVAVPYAHSGAIGEYGVSFQYDPYLAAYICEGCQKTTGVNR
jgi:hypothetical protein